MHFNKYNGHRSERGFSLIEILIGSVVGMLGIVIIMKVFLVSEEQKRTTTGGADAVENGLMALFTMEQDIRMAGLGLVGTGCALVNTYDANATPTTGSKAMWPAIINRDSPAAGSDSVSIMYSASPFGNIPSTITSAMPDSSAILNILNGDGFVQGDIFIISEPPKDCSRAQASQDGQKTGTTWNLQHNPGGSFPLNPPGGANIFPAGGYGPGARVTNMGRMVDNTYFVQDGNLMLRNNNAALAAGTNPLAIVNGIVAIRAQYGRDTTLTPDGYVDVYDNAATSPTSLSTPAQIANRLTEVVSVRLAVVARSGQEEKEDVTPNPLVLWAGGTTGNGGQLSLNPKYRYKTYQTIIPLRNIVWNTP